MSLTPAHHNPSPSAGPGDFGDHFFEGVEKLLEIWFEKSSAIDPENASLRRIPRNELDRLLDLAGCQIVSHMPTERMDAYVLSESSLFLSDQRCILKTCGTTKLMDGFDTLLELAHRYGGFTEVVNVFYSRKNFVHPELQCARHRSFDAEVQHLNQYFEDDNGAAYCLGRLNQDRWYLYTLNPPRVSMPSADQTLEILMSDLDPRVMQNFINGTCHTAKDATKLGGIEWIVPLGTVIDDKLFEPCGYSMNGVLEGTDEYITIHVTPEPNFSYVSYESNVSEEHMTMLEQTCRVLSVFKPRRFLITMFANTHSFSKKDQQILWEHQMPGYKCKDLQFLSLSNYTLVYAQFEIVTDANLVDGVGQRRKKSWTGGVSSRQS